MPRRRRLLLAAAVSAAALSAAPVAAALEIRRVDTSGYPTIGVTVVTSRPVGRRPLLVEGARAVAGVSAQNLGAAKSVVLAIDRSRSMRGKPLADAAAAARIFLATKQRADRVAVVAFGAGVVELTRFSASPADATAALGSLGVDRREGTALYDALGLAARAFASEGQGARVVVVLSDGRDVSSSRRLGSVLTSARRARAVVYPIGIRAPGFRAGPLRRIAARTGGHYYPAASSAELTRIYGMIARELERTWRLEYATAARPGSRVRLHVEVQGEGSTSAEVSLGAARGSGGGRGTARTFASPWGDVLVALAVGLLVLLAGRLVSARRRIGRLRRRLRPDEPAQERERGPSLRERVSGGAAGLFAATERALGGLRQWEALERVLSRADVPLRAVELLYAMAGAGLALALLALVVGLSPVLVLVVFAAGASAPLAAVRLKARRRMNEFDEQLPELLMTLASSLKAGHTFRQGIQTIVDEGKDPARKEFQRVLSEARLGRPLEAALAEMADRLASENFSFVVSAVTIQRQVGGSLAGIFDMVAGAVRQRQLFARKLKALTAQGRMSAYVLMAMPVGVGLVLSVINPGYMAPLYVTGTGHVLLLAGLGLMAIGAFLLKRIVAFAE